MWSHKDDDSAGFAEALPDSVYALGVLFIVGLAGIAVWALLP